MDRWMQSVCKHTYNEVTLSQQCLAHPKQARQLKKPEKKSISTFVIYPLKLLAIWTSLNCCFSVTS